ncbi:MAG: hypothetical protein PHZ19_08430, partial [Candidatus Thermoplasmatota archaeon]|nr:hypothetical protein [Candidatus Thermoplasmatota archaeon]
GYSDNRSIEFVMEGYANELKMYLEQMEASLWPAQWPYPHTIGHAELRADGGIEWPPLPAGARWALPPPSPLCPSPPPSGAYHE